MQKLLLSIFILFSVITVKAQINSDNGIRYTMKLLLGFDYTNPKDDTLRSHFFFYSNKLVEIVEKIEINGTVTVLDQILNNESPIIKDTTTYVVTKVLVTDLKTKTTHVFDTFSVGAKMLQTLAYDSLKIGFMNGWKFSNTKKETPRQFNFKDTLIKNIPHKFNLEVKKDINGKDSIHTYGFWMDTKIKTPFNFYPELNCGNLEYTFIGLKTLFIKEKAQIVVLADDFQAIKKEEMDVLNSLIAKTK